MIARQLEDRPMGRELKNEKRGGYESHPFKALFQACLRLIALHRLGSFGSHLDGSWVHQRFFLKFRVRLRVWSFATTDGWQSQQSNCQ